MATVKMTFTLDEATANRLNQTALRLSKPKSEVVREAIEEYHAKGGRMSEAERLMKLRVLAEHMAKGPTRPQAEVRKELKEIRESRKHGWHRPSDLK